MASPAELAQALPATLPEDFSEWDGGENSSAAPPPEGRIADSNGFGAESKRSAQSEQPQFSEPQITVAPKVDQLRHEPPPSSPTVYPDYETLGGSLRAIGAALKSEPTSALNGQANPCAMNDASLAPLRSGGAVMHGLRNARSLLPPTACADHEPLGGSPRSGGTALKAEPASASNGHATACLTNDVSFQPVRTNGAVVDGLRSAPSLSPPAACADEEAFFHELQAIGTVLNTRPIRSSHRPVLARVTDEVSFKLIPSSGAVERRRPIKSNPVAETMGVADEVRIPSFRSGLGDLEEMDPNLKKWIKVAVIGVAAILLLIFLGVRLMSPGKPTLAKQSVEPQPAAADAESTTNIRKPSPSMQSAAGRLSTTAKTQSVMDAEPGTNAADNPAAPVDSKLMNDQLTAAPRIPQDIKAKAKEVAPPPDGSIAASSEEVADASVIGGALGEETRPKVAYVPYPIVTIPAAVADGLLTQKTKPVYPADAWYNHITGKVVFAATVSRTGSVENLYFVSGPHVFRQAALDAAKTWRYKPYVIDNVPREFQTTVEVIFDQKGGGNPLSLLHLGSHSNKASAALKSEGAGAP
jgi:protein TonB